MIEKDIIHKEIDLIQDVIKRMANNSFLIKGWYITVVSALLLVTKADLVLYSAISFWIVLVAPFLFWCLDAYYLGQEAIFRKLYSWIIRERLAGNEDFLYDMTTTERCGNRRKFILRAFVSPTLLVFYALPIITMIAIIFRAK